MTREEAIEILQGAIKKPNTKDGYLGQAIDMAIKALEQEPVIDKIRAEIKDYFSITCDGNCDNCNRVVKNPCGESVDGAWVLHIIDKYKAEQEET